MSKNSWMFLPLALLLAAGCAQDREPATALVMSVMHDLNTELASVVVRVYPTTANLATDAEKPSSETTIGAADLGKPVVINHAGVDELLVVVRGLNAAGAPIIEQAVRARFADAKSIAVHVFLGSSCLNKACANPGETCYAEPGATQCGACAPIAIADGAAIDNAGEEASWQPRMCPVGDAGIDAVAGDADTSVAADADAGDADAGDADAGDADAGDANAIASDAGPVDSGVCSVPADSRNPCTIAPLCGCGVHEGCSLVFPIINPQALEFKCEPRGIGQLDAKCTSNADCAPSFTCLGYGFFSACRRDCTATRDCPQGQYCDEIQNAKTKETIPGVGVCETKCTKNADCSDGCCNNGECAPRDACRRDGVSCDDQADCVGSNSARGGVCVESTDADGGVIAACRSVCVSDSDCSGDCCRPFTTGTGGFCIDGSGLTNAERQQFCSGQ